MKDKLIQALVRIDIRKNSFRALVVIALLLVGIVSYVIATDDRPIAADDAFIEPVIVDAQKHPEVVFPENVRTNDLSLNRFVDRFARVCTQGRYSDFRLMLSTKRPPVLPPRFESNFNALKQVRIQSITQIPNVPASVGSVFLMVAEYDLQDYAVKRGERTKSVQVALAREEGSWRLGPIPHEAMELLRAYRNSATAAVPIIAPTSTQAAESSKMPARASANQPISLPQ